MDTLERITQDPGIMGGKPCIRGMRVTVGMIAGQLAGERSIDDLLADFPYLEREDVVQALPTRRGGPGEPNLDENAISACHVWH